MVCQTVDREKEMKNTKYIPFGSDYHLIWRFRVYLVPSSEYVRGARFLVTGWLTD